MKTTRFIEHVTESVAKPDAAGQWLRGTLPVAMNGGATFIMPVKAWLGSLEALLDVADTLRRMQLGAVHNTQARAAHLAKALGESATPFGTATTLQQFLRENFQHSIQHGNSYREIVQAGEIRMFDAAKKTLAKSGEAARSHSKVPVRAG